MLPACRTESGGFSIPTFDVEASDVEGFVEELWEFQSAFHDCFARSEPRYHFFDYMVGQLSGLSKKSLSFEFSLASSLRKEGRWPGNASRSNEPQMNTRACPPMLPTGTKVPERSTVHGFYCWPTTAVQMQTSQRSWGCPASPSITCARSITTKGISISWMSYTMSPVGAAL
jgi:hypothetical protein